MLHCICFCVSCRETLHVTSIVCIVRTSALKDFHHIYVPRQIIRSVHTLAELSDAAYLSQLYKLIFLEGTILNLTKLLKL
jgi:hypothetical protein